MSEIKFKRVIVVDDDIEEAKKLFKFLNFVGVPFNYFTGNDKDEFPIEKFETSVRFIFLDVHLTNDGNSETDIKNNISTMISVLNKLIKKNNEPYIIFLWTKFDEDCIEELLFESIVTKKEIALPHSIIKLNKKKYLHEFSHEEAIENLKEEIQTLTTDQALLNFLFDFEKKLDKSSEDLLSWLQNISKPNSMSNAKNIQEFKDSLGKWNSKFNDLINKLSQIRIKEPGQNARIIESQISLVSLFIDFFERNLCKKDIEPTEYVKKEETSKALEEEVPTTQEEEVPTTQEEDKNNIVNKDKSIDKEDSINIIDINSRLHFTELISEEEMSTPGNIYLSNVKDKETNPLLESLKEHAEGVGKGKNIESKGSNFKLIFLDLTQSCYSIINFNEPSFCIPGILFKPESDIKFNGDLKFYDKCGVDILLEGEKHKILFIKNQSLTISKEELKKLTQIGRIRKEMLTDIQSWNAFMLSRPGKSNVQK